ncbi:hypothetical protein BCR33DRAFT_844753 [Rhizoclosmatium globosum]|uniref:BZIP domain-containing protein n=1 Tax=Rhizoclosmatium globosum TaxID=329046 RepID=A0A1Y2D2S5_9FUNG|nr:hypothetical protein BCR33DRAFT_844753 [Rhizoclosmatium globosum]|eukprot:ORY53416.1 hypothetical protein BCR33DRAFT_844753 [Rhizoclosmatium globosum]
MEAPSSPDKAAAKAAQNRAAQRSFRIRKEARIRELEDIVRKATENGTITVEQRLEREERWMRRIRELEEENRHLRANHQYSHYPIQHHNTYHPYAYHWPPPAHPPPPPAFVYTPPVYAPAAAPISTITYSNHQQTSTSHNKAPPTKTPETSKELSTTGPVIEPTRQALSKIRSLNTDAVSRFLQAFTDLFEASMSDDSERVGKLYFESARSRNAILDLCSDSEERDKVLEIYCSMNVANKEYGKRVEQHLVNCATTVKESLALYEMKKRSTEKIAKDDITSTHTIVCHLPGIKTECQTLISLKNQNDCITKFFESTELLLTQQSTGDASAFYACGINCVSAKNLSFCIKSSMDPSDPHDHHDAERAAARAAQNREAQRNFRIRKEARIRELEEIVRKATENGTVSIEQRLEREEQLIRRVKQLEDENRRLKASHPYYQPQPQQPYYPHQHAYHPYGYYWQPPPPGPVTGPVYLPVPPVLPPPPIIQPVQPPVNQPIQIQPQEVAPAVTPLMEPTRVALSELSCLTPTAITRFCRAFTGLFQECMTDSSDRIGKLYFEAVSSRNNLLDLCTSKRDRERVVEIHFNMNIANKEFAIRLESHLVICASAARESVKDLWNDLMKEKEKRQHSDPAGADSNWKQAGIGHLPGIKAECQAVQSVKNQNKLIDDFFICTEFLLTQQTTADPSVLYARGLDCGVYRERLLNISTDADRLKLERLFDQIRTSNKTSVQDIVNDLNSLEI